MTIKDKNFELFISSAKIQGAVKELSERINQDYSTKNPVFIAILNGCFMFTSDLMKHINFPCELTFVKFVSYSGMKSSGKVSELIGIGIDLKDRHVIVLEDIVDTGHTMMEIEKLLMHQMPSSIEIASLLVKPDALKHPVDVKYRCLNIPNDFVVGYGLDYDGYGRNHDAIYKVVG
ncbi:MAG: hypoxanthine phosphoribosyltransferase [Bacteroidetes bacterium RIFCSPLOWO2_02_FULL_36_8]|nr:MAG: hypoxanthine phosphoribosyltransferase [Bacteroidetes bacterium RIFCSPLOWO2_02_FULL_36_8]OFY69662.1 MAG: hypoxanthine phosphoribosyltransferase [Bacteroidetes bacterium RIFCSPLOWO2_12_FULL_37_12]